MDRVLDAIRYFLTSDMLNPHGICLLWRPELIWTHAISDLLIGVAYFSIPLALGTFLYHRRDVRFGWAIWMFVAFIMLCGVTHFMMIWTLWNADYGIEALIKAATATASVITAVALWPLLPKIIALPSPAALEARIRERDQALLDLKAVMADMVELREHEQRQKLLLDELKSPSEEHARVGPVHRCPDAQEVRRSGGCARYVHLAAGGAFQDAQSAGRPHLEQRSVPRHGRRDTRSLWKAVQLRRPGSGTSPQLRCDDGHGPSRVGHQCA
jgi:hypothetical protein